METPLAYSFAEFIHKNCIGNSSNLNEDFLRSIVSKPKSTGSKVKSQPLRLPNPGKIQGPCSPVRDGHHPRNLSWLMVFPLPGTPFPTCLPHSCHWLHTSFQMSSVPWNLCLLLSASSWALPLHCLTRTPPLRLSSLVMYSVSPCPAHSHCLAQR